MTFLFDLFKDQIKACLSFDSWINDYAIQTVLRKENNTFKAMVTFCCSSSAARVKMARILDEGQKIFLLTMPYFSESNHVFSVLFNFVFMYQSHQGDKYLLSKLQKHWLKY